MVLKGKSVHPGEDRQRPGETPDGYWRVLGATELRAWATRWTISNESAKPAISLAWWSRLISTSVGEKLTGTWLSRVAYVPNCAERGGSA